MDYAFSEAVFVQNQLGGPSIVVDHNGNILKTIIESRFEMSQNMVITKNCLWFGNEGSILSSTPSKNYGNIVYSLSCLNRKTNQLKDYPFNEEGFGGVDPIRTTDGKSAIFSSSFGGKDQWLIKISDDGSFIKKNYKNSFAKQTDLVDFDVGDKYIMGSNLFMPMTFYFKDTEGEYAGKFTSYHTVFAKIDTTTMEVRGILNIDENHKIATNIEKNTLIIASGEKDQSRDGEHYKFKLGEYDENFKLIKKINFNSDSNLLNDIELLGASKNYIYIDQGGEIMRYDYVKNKLEILLNIENDIITPSGELSSTAEKILIGKYVFISAHSRKTKNLCLLILNTETKKYKIAYTNIRNGYISPWNPPQ